MNNRQKTILTGIACWLSVGTVAIAQQTVDSNYVFSHYNEQIALFETLPMPKKAVVFVGNSITEAGRWTDLLPGLPIANRGISGDISFGVVARLDQILQHRPAKIFVMIGTNDLKREVPESYIVANHQKIIHKIKGLSPKTRIYVQSVLPVNYSLLPESFNKITNEKVQSLNQKLATLAQEYQVEFVDLHEIFAAPDGQLKEELTPDGIHLKLTAYRQWVDYLRTKKHL